MKKLLQKIVLPKDEKLQSHWGLFYRGPRLAMNLACSELYIPCGTTVDFATYLNGFSIQKWSLYTDVKGVSLKVRIQGRGALCAVGYHLNPTMPDRHQFFAQEFDFSEPTEIDIPFPAKTNEQLLSFEILPYSDCIFYSGEFYGEFAESAVRNVNLCLATTTCRKEEFIKNNVQLLKDELLCEDSEVRENFFVHVVDNGRTLLKEEIEGYHVTLHPNKNVGGSGGFARGMIESMHQTPQATHVLLMDDDVLVLPESIRRTYTLLTVLKDEWKGAFVSGAMLKLEAMNIQHEDIGTVIDHGNYIPARPQCDQYWLGNVLQTNCELPNLQNPYAAWWYCCIPMSQIKKNKLPLPLFVRVDDIEYSLRARPKFISMTGFCVWHMGFANKYNISMEIYQTYRNQLVSKAVTNVALNDVMWKIKKVFYKQLVEYYYDGAELLLLALEDYMKGPAFIEQDLGEKLLKEHAAYNEKLRPLSEFNIEVRLERVYDDPPIPKWKWLLFCLTLNFQQFWPRFLLNKRFAAVKGFDWSRQFGIIFRHKEILAVNPFDRTANLRVQDRKRFRSLMRRYFKDMLLYNLKHRRIERAYAAKRDWLTSEEFWKQYLEI